MNDFLSKDDYEEPKCKNALGLSIKTLHERRAENAVPVAASIEA